MRALFADLLQWGKIFLWRIGMVLVVGLVVVLVVGLVVLVGCVIALLVVYEGRSKDD